MSEKNSNGRKEAGELSPMATSRARNRTVMLSSDMTDQVRTLIQSSGEEEKVEEESLRSDFVAPLMFSSVSPEVKKEGKAIEDEGKTLTTSVRDLLNTQEHAKSTIGGSHDTSTLVHKSITNFDMDRDILAKSRVSNIGARIRGFLISFDKDEFGEIYELREGRSIVSSNPSNQGVVITIVDESISTPHAVFRIGKEGQVLILDQLSENGTGVIKSGLDNEIEALGSPVELRHGDIIRFGARYFVFCAVPKIAIQD